MHEKLTEEYFAQLPTGPGIYRFYNAYQQLLYVGKSMHLRQRIRSYFHPSQTWSKVDEMLRILDRIEIEETDTHLDARLLECQWIQTYHPPFNAAMRNSRNYVFLTLSLVHGIGISRTRKRNSIGPFRSQHRLQDFKLRMMRLLIENNGLFHHIINNEQAANAFLYEVLQSSPKIQTLQTQLTQARDHALAEENYERAEQLGNPLPILEEIQAKLENFENFLAKAFYFSLEIPNGVKHYYVSQGLVQHTEIQKTQNAWQKEPLFSLPYFLFYGGAQVQKLHPSLAYDRQEILLSAHRSGEINLIPVEEILCR